MKILELFRRVNTSYKAKAYPRFVKGGFEQKSKAVAIREGGGGGRRAKLKRLSIIYTCCASSC